MTTQALPMTPRRQAKRLLIEAAYGYNPTIIEHVDDKTTRGIEAILRAVEDVRNGTLMCPCPECELRRITDEVPLA